MKTYYIGKWGDGSKQWYVAWEKPKGQWHDASFWSKEMAERWLKMFQDDAKENYQIVYKDGLIQLSELEYRWS